MSGARVVGIEDEYDAVMNGVDVGRDAAYEKLAPVLAGCVTFFGPKPSAANLSRRDVLGLPNEGNSSSVTLPAAVFFKRSLRGRDLATSVNTQHHRVLQREEDVKGWLWLAIITSMLR